MFPAILFNLIIAILIALPAGAATYLGPNELHPIFFKLEVGDHRQGTLIAVGTERGLMHAILATNITHLVLLDHDPKVVRFNKINLALLKAARSREEYVYLRFRATRFEWLELGLGHQHQWWRDSFEDYDFFDFHYAALNPEDDEFVHPNGLRPFGAANYLTDDQAFARIRQMAITGKITVVQGSLSNRDEMRSLFISHAPVSLVDVSNSWWDTFAGPKAIATLSDDLGLIHPQARLVYTELIHTVGVGRDWTYHAVTAGDPKLLGTLTDLAKTADKWLAPVLKRFLGGCAADLNGDKKADD